MTVRVFVAVAKTAETPSARFTSNASAGPVPAPSGESAKSNATAGFVSEISPQSFAYFFSVTFLTTAPQVDSSSFTSSFSSVTSFSGTDGSAGFGASCGATAASRTGAAGDATAAAADAAAFVADACPATAAACSAASFARSLAFPVSL